MPIPPQRILSTFILLISISLLAAACSEEDSVNNTSDTASDSSSGATDTSGNTTSTDTSGVTTAADTSGVTTANDTSGADTSGADTSGADTSGADTSGADTSGADTSGADTSGADTSGADTSGGGGPTYTNDVQPIYEAKCASCHTGGGSGGVNFGISYSDTQLDAGACAGLTVGECTLVRIQNGSMPRGRGCTGDPVTDAANTSCLTADEQQTIQDWIDAGMPE